MKCKVLQWLVISFMCVISLEITIAQEQTPLAKSNLKVGLVLSGGGAKGLAHIGALKQIEEAGLQIDYIGGTSMGAIVGGLYASGYTATQLDSLFHTIDFNSLIQDNLPRSAKTFYEKEDAARYALTLPFDRFSVSVPSAISRGQNVYNLLSKLTSHVNGITDFSKLPIPFFCMATNVETGQSVKLDSGYLPQAISASGALPSLFSPVAIGDSLYIDGGVLNNYPVDEVRAMGADVVIGVDVQDALRGRQELESALNVLVQINNYRTINVMEAKSKRTDLYIKPDIKGFSVVSFNEGAKIIESGMLAATKHMATLKKWAALQNKNKPIKQVPSPKEFLIKDVIVTGNAYYTENYILGKLKLRLDQHTNFEALSEGVNNLSATGNFENINYRLKPINEDKEVYTLQLQLREVPNRTLLRLGLHYDNLLKSAVLVNITQKRIFTNNDVLATDFILGDNLRYNLEYYIDKGYFWSVGFKSNYTFFHKNVNVNFLEQEPNFVPTTVNKVDLEYEDFSNKIFGQTVFQRQFLLRLGLAHKWLRYLSETIGEPTQTNLLGSNDARIVFENTNYLSTFGTLKYDSFDDKYFPTKGLLFEGNFNWYFFGSEDIVPYNSFSIAKAKIAYVFSPINNFSITIGTQGGFKLGGKQRRSLDFFLGGYGYKDINNLVPFLGLDALQLRGNTYLKSSCVFNLQASKNTYLFAAINIANVGDDLFEDGSWIREIPYTGYAGGIAFKTLLGPAKLTYAYTPELNSSQWYVNVGYSF